MRPVAAVLIFVALVFVGGALIAPWLHAGVQFASAKLGIWEGLARQPFHRYVSRAMMVLAVGGLIPLLKQVGLTSWRGVGWVPKPDAGRQLGLGLLMGFGSLAVVVLCTLAAGARSWNGDHTSAEVWKHLRNAFLAAVLVSPIEETVFRGGLFGGLRQGGSWKLALWLSSGIYAIVHFFERPGSPAIVTWSSGLAVLGEMLRGFANLEQIVPGFFNLTLAGIILALGYQRTGSLYFSAGLHAGWIFWLKTYGFFTSEVANRSKWFWGSGKLIDGWFAGLVLLLVLIGLTQRTRNAE